MLPIWFWWGSLSFDPAYDTLIWPNTWLLQLNFRPRPPSSTATPMCSTLQPTTIDKKRSWYRWVGEYKESIVRKLGTASKVAHWISSKTSRNKENISFWKGHFTSTNINKNTHRILCEENLKENCFPKCYDEDNLSASHTFNKVKHWGHCFYVEPLWTNYLLFFDTGRLMIFAVEFSVYECAGLL